ncbi:DUF418 domain-containing protein [Nocardiopsis potens]|uniref:DUF418 domain-containing protein n=1 Tax=Nocardiopsis potens TaxID=1246458 RepID=UPI0003482373|nr:DUF418 domain-containing protein [Nocardiopsis potens]
MDDTHRPLRGPVRAGERAPAPDLARGAMLLLIALANTPFYLWGREYGSVGFHPADGTVADRVVQAVIITGVDMRVYPMFAFLFGYGMVQLLSRQRASGTSERDALALLRRRNLWLLAFGAVHALLLFTGDVLGAYGLAGLVLAWLFIRRADRTLLVWAGLGGALLAAMTVLGAVGAYFAAAGGAPAPEETGPTAFLTASASAEDPLQAALLRISTWPVIVLGQGLLGLTVPVAILLAFWAARRRVLEEPWNHLRLLRATAAVGIPAGWLGGLPYALDHVGVLDVPASADWVFALTQMSTGLLCGLGYVALFGLIGARLHGRAPGPVGGAVAAVGKRSLTCYLAQSVLCAPLLSAWGLGLGGVLGSAAMALFAAGVWLATVLLAVGLERSGRRGPAEAALRRLAYRRPAAAEPGRSSGATR